MAIVCLELCGRGTVATAVMRSNHIHAKAPGHDKEGENSEAISRRVRHWL